jgi:hypothetical protein
LKRYLIPHSRSTIQLPALSQFPPGSFRRHKLARPPAIHKTQNLLPPCSKIGLRTGDGLIAFDRVVVLGELVAFVELAALDDLVGLDGLAAAVEELVAVDGHVLPHGDAPGA